MQTSEFYSYGKLLLTGEYVVLDGAEALALPCKLGQSLVAKKSNDDRYTWTSYLRNGEVWQSLTFSLDDILQNTSHTGFEKRLFQILKTIYDLNPDIFQSTYDFSTKLDFEKDWGLGSSSTLINNIAQWGNVDPYALLDKTFGGSGYDIAAASMHSPFIYRRSGNKVYTKAVELSERLRPHLYFVYLNQKQNSRMAIDHYRRIAQKERLKTIKKINEITQDVTNVNDLNTFESLLKSHENIISELIGQQPVQEKIFSDYNKGFVKSLGAWGGDFVLVTAKEKSDLNYFTQKGFDTIFKYEDLVF